MKRLLTGLVMLPLFFWIVAYGPDAVFLGALAVVGCFCLYEFFGILAARFPEYESVQRNPAGYAAGLFLLILPSSEGLFLTLFALLALLLTLRSRDLGAVIPLAGGLVLGVLYVFGPWRAAVGLRAIGPWWMLFALAVNWAGDTFAYYTGRAIGKRKLAPRVSPGKSWEGTIASSLASMGLGVLYLHYLQPGTPAGWAVLLCFAANAAGQLGDLAESALKRGAGVKDSGTLLPGHGGWLDRVDSSLFSVPVVYWLLSQEWFPR
ncbi:MAG: phosphatidate cytidylyltransferase [Bryobacteraceae bacterium]|nr:phosphatidate cytidylyltransferase [Bryobacteraceae bacterium]